MAVAHADRIDEPKFKSDLERRAWYEWIPTTGAVIYKYEPFILKLTGHNYTIDFLLVMPTGRMWLIEVKGHYKAYKSGDSSRIKTKQAAREFGFLGDFVVLTWNREEGIWKTELIRPGRRSIRGDGELPEYKE